MSSGQFSQLLLEGLDHYRKGRMMEAVRAWEEAYLLEPTNLRAREFLRSALERIHAHMGPAQPADAKAPAAPAPGTAAAHPWLPNTPATPEPSPAGTAVFARPPGLGEETAISRAPSFMEPPAASPPTGSKKVPLQPPSSPWDDGPSMAIPQEERPPSYAGDETSGAWKIHSDPLPMDAVADHEVDVWMRGARELVALNDFSGALELTAKILERKPTDKDALQMHETCEHNLTLMFESKIGGMEGRPRMAIPPDEVIWLNLDPRAGFVLAQIDGEVTFDDLYAICGLKRLDTARILSELLEQGVVSIEGQDRAVAKRAMHRT